LRTGTPVSQNRPPRGKEPREETQSHIIKNLSEARFEEGKRVAIPTLVGTGGEINIVPKEHHETGKLATGGIG